MAKKITDENGNTYVQKKPFYKKVWFWAIVVILIFIIGGSLGTSKAKKVEDGSSTASSEKKSEQTTFKIGDVVEHNNVQFKVNSVEYSSGTKYSKPKEGNQYVIVNITITNKGDDTIDYNPYDFKLDSNGNQTNLTEFVMADSGEQFVNDSLNSGSLAKDGSVTGSLIGQAKVGDKYKLLYNGNMFSNKSKITFELN
ncbi:DUF4352 domain-containing protein [Streptococcaceae bacterium ESL0687]|nr:DUF4352 domain-containing protein [Streptococcaceae bacterium ESL0687]